jgi:hypothetical protein
MSPKKNLVKITAAIMLLANLVLTGLAIEPGKLTPGVVFAANFFNYLPLILNKQESTPTPTPTTTPPVVIATPTVTPTVDGMPVPASDNVKFRDWLDDEILLEGVVTFSEYQTVLTPDYGDPVTPQGIFVVILMDVTNHGLESGSVGMFSSFRLQDSQNRKFDMADLEAQWAAQDMYDRDGVYEDIQPGFTVPRVFVFDVLPSSTGLHLVSDSPW